MTGVDPDAAAALARQKGISVAEANKRLGQERVLGERGARLEKSLAGRSGGSYLDANGQLVVTSSSSSTGSQPRAVPARCTAGTSTYRPTRSS